MSPHGLLLAYIDPGAGSLLIQVVIASILAVPYFLRNQIRRVLGVVRGRASNENLTDEDPKPTAD